MTAQSFINLRKISNYLTSLGLSLIELIFPCRCVLCQRSGGWLCQFCLAKLGTKPKFISSKVLYRHRQVPKRFFPAIAGVWYFWDYGEPAVKKIIQSYKFGQIKDLSLVFKQMLGDFFKDFSGVEVVALPPDKKRLRMRGFDHIKEMVPPKLLSKKIYLTRIKSTPTQSLTSGFRERWQNVKGIFQARGQGGRGPSTSLRTTRSRVVFLVDDILTTGATAASAAEALRPYTKKIYLIVLVKA